MKSNETDEVLKANAFFYQAFRGLDIPQMEKLWLKESYVQCFHPGWGALRGWEAVITSWKRIFANTSGFKFVLSEVQVEIRGPIAWVTLYENLTTRIDDEVTSGVVLATNVFEKRAEGWFMIHHHGSTVVAPPARPTSNTVH